jgi:hypothetical protein
MNNEFIPYEQALALKGLGFDELCFGWYNERQTLLWFTQDNFWHEMDEAECIAPLYQQAFRWFREKYAFYVNMVDSDLFYFVVHLVNPIKEPTDLFISEHCKTHEEAELACLKKLIELSTKTA